MRELVGSVGVDSGLIWIGDPCYFNEPKRWDIPNLEKIAKEHDDKNEDNMAEKEVGVTKESVEEGKKAIIEILQSGQDQATIQVALEVLRDVTQVDNVVIEGNTFGG